MLLLKACRSIYTFVYFPARVDTANLPNVSLEKTKGLTSNPYL